VDLDAPERERTIRDLLARKPALRRYYNEVYERFADLLGRCPPGPALEIGSGGGFVKDVIPAMITSDVIPYPSLDRVIDATAMDFSDGEFAAICMHNVFHHIADVQSFLAEAGRVLKPGGRLLIVDQHPGWLSTPIFAHAHSEPFRPEAETWGFASSGPLSAANGALAWIVFVRDRLHFDALFPELEVVGLTPHSPLRYWLAGGLRSWSALPGWAFRPATWLDRALVAMSPQLASFVDIEIVRRP
jgi:SAM-dependent methyltransferase